MASIRVVKKGLANIMPSAAHWEVFDLDDELFINYADEEMWINDGGGL